MDTGSFEFERTELHKHLAITQKVCKEVFGFENIFFEIIPCKGYDEKSQLVSDTFFILKIAVWIFVLPNQIHIIIITTALELKLRLLLMG